MLFNLSKNWKDVDINSPIDFIQNVHRYKRSMYVDTKSLTNEK